MIMPAEPLRDASTVYVVDDGADYRFLVRKVFTQFLPQYNVALFPGGDSLLSHLQTSPVRPALILLDLHMPGLSGIQTLMRLKQDPFGNGPAVAGVEPEGTGPDARPVRSIPVVMVTSSSSAQEIQACYEAGANSCLAKPIGFGPLRQRLTQVCTYWVDTNRPFLA